MSIESLIQLDKHLLLLWNGSDSLFLDGFVTTLTTASTWIPLYISLFYLVIKNNENMRRILIIIGCAAICVVAAGTIDDMIVKPLVSRFRPTHDSQIGMLVDVVNEYRGGSYGFFSAHAANTFSIAIFFSLLMRSRLLTLFLVSWSLINCWTRIYLGVHYPFDILTGLIWGGVVGTSVYFLYLYLTRKEKSGLNFISSQYTISGYQLTDIDTVISVLVFTLIYAIIRGCIIM